MYKQLVVLMLAVMPLCGCGTTESTGYGHVSPEVINLYHSSAPAGMMELEIDSRGVIYEAETDIDPADLPDNVLTAAKARAGDGATVTGAEIEYGGQGMTYEVKFDRGGIGLEYVVDAGGRVLEEEQELSRNAAPTKVVEAGLGALPGAFKSVEIIKIADGETIYHVKTMANGVSYKAVVSADGIVTRAVREARAEIEIPLR